MILVVGTGRCGTSTVARLLHEKLGVSMGRTFDPPRPSNPDGVYEDLEFRDLHVAFHRGDISLPQFRHRFTTLLDQRGEPWGLKDPRIAHHIGLYLQWLDFPWVVWCCRDPDAVARSIHRWYHTPLDEAHRETADRWIQLQRGLTGYPRLHKAYFDLPVSDDELLWRLKRDFAPLLYRAGER